MKSLCTLFILFLSFAAHAAIYQPYQYGAGRGQAYMYGQQQPYGQYQQYGQYQPYGQYNYNTYAYPYGYTAPYEPNNGPMRGPNSIQGHQQSSYSTWYGNQP